MAKAKVRLKPIAHTASTSPLLQWFFLIAVVITVVMQIAQAIYMLIQQSANGPIDFGTYFSWFLGIGISALIWVALYLTRRNRTPSVKTLFEVTLLTFSAVLLATGLSWLTTFIPLRFASGANLSQLMMIWSALYTGLPLIITIPALVYVILRLRDAKQW